jgi:chromate transporter
MTETVEAPVGGGACEAAPIRESDGAGLSEQSEGAQETERPCAPAHSVLWTLFLCGLVPTGGKPVVLMIPEMVERRRWLTSQQFSEAIAFGYALPGPVLISTVVYLASLLPTRLPMLLCLTVFLLPGAVMLLGMAAFFLDSGRPWWVDGAVRGLGPAAVGMLVSSTWSVFPTALSARLGLATAALAFSGVALFKLELHFVLVPLALLSLFLNRPKEVLA